MTELIFHSKLILTMQLYVTLLVNPFTYYYKKDMSLSCPQTYNLIIP